MTPSSLKKCKKVLAKHPFEFNTICNVDSFCLNVLKIKKYPTHIVIDKKGELKEIDISKLWPRNDFFNAKRKFKAIDSRRI